MRKTKREKSWNTGNYGRANPAVYLILARRTLFCLRQRFKKITLVNSKPSCLKFFRVELLSAMAIHYGSWFYTLKTKLLFAAET